jgi:hypothetical protein
LKYAVCGYFESVENKDINDAVMTTGLAVTKKRFDKVTYKDTQFETARIISTYLLISNPLVINDSFSKYLQGITIGLHIVIKLKKQGRI